MDAFSKIVAGLILIASLFLVSPLYFMLKEDAIVESYVIAVTEEFVNNVQTQGRLTQDMYLDFINDLDASGRLYNINMEHQHTAMSPIYDDAGSYTGFLQTTDEMHYEDEILYCVFEKQLTATEIAAGQVSGEYHFTKGDYFTVKVSNRNTPTSVRFLRILLGRDVSPVQILAVNGGAIRDENY